MRPVAPRYVVQCLHLKGIAYYRHHDIDGLENDPIFSYNKKDAFIFGDLKAALRIREEVKGEVRIIATAEEMKEFQPEAMDETSSEEDA